MLPIAIITDTDSSLPVALSASTASGRCRSISTSPETFQAGVDIDDAGAFVRIDRDEIADHVRAHARPVRRSLSDCF